MRSNGFRKLVSVVMVYVVLVLLCLLFTMCGCRSAAPRLNASVPSGYYLVVGHVNKPGLIKCGETEKTLKALINEAGGPTRNASLDSIQVSFAGTTNYFNLNENPMLPCGARVHVSFPLFDLIR